MTYLFSDRLRLQRFNIGGESENLLLRQLPLKGGHQGLIPGNNFGTGLQNRFADVSIIRGDGRAVCQENLGSIKTAEGWSAAGAIGNMTSDAGLFGEELFAGNDGIGFPARRAGKPCGVIGRFHHRNPAAH